jgi:hypothetical protein
MEMGWRGATHLPLSEQTSEQSAVLEIKLASRVFAALGIAPGRLRFRVIRLVTGPCFARMDLKIIERAWRTTG